MADELTLHLDLTEVVKHNEKIVQQVQEKLNVAAKQLAIQTHAHVKEEAARRLHTRRDMFLEHLDFEPIDKSTWAIVVKQKGRWIEDGMEPHSMLDDLLKSPKAKRAKDGSKYMVIPFKQNKGPTQRTPHQTEMLNSLKSALKAQKIPYGKIERNADGSVKTGLLHKMDLHGPSQVRPGMGAQGPVGRPFATHTPGVGEEGPSGRPYLWGVRVYQKLKRNPDGSPKLGKGGQQMGTREIFTFRVASSKHPEKFFHPGLAPMHFLEDAYKWAKDQWETKIEPEILKSIGG
jgi:hypothetical protein